MNKEESVEAAIKDLEERTFEMSQSFVGDITDSEVCSEADASSFVDWNTLFQQSNYTKELDSERVLVPANCWDPEVYCQEDGCSDGLCRILDGFYVCQKCGTFGNSCIESGAEWRNFGNEDAKVSDPSRCGNTTINYLLPEQIIGTMISPKWKESEQMRHARQCHRWNSSHSRGRTLIAIFNELQRVAYKNGFSRMIVEDTKHLYKTTTEYHMFRGDNRKGLYAYCLFHTCKKHNVPRSIKEICELFDVDEQTLTKGHSAFNKVLKESDTLANRRLQDDDDDDDMICSSSTTSSKKVNNNTKQRRVRKPRTYRKCDDGSKLEMMAKPSDYIDRFCSRLQLSAEICNHVHSTVTLIQKLGLSTDNPSLIAASAIHMVLRKNGLSSTTAVIQEVSNISHVTIDKCYKKLMAFEEALFPP